MRTPLTICFLVLATFSLVGTFSDKENPVDKKSYKNLSVVFGALALLAAAIVD